MSEAAIYTPQWTWAVSNCAHRSLKRYIRFVQLLVVVVLNSCIGFLMCRKRRNDGLDCARASFGPTLLLDDPCAANATDDNAMRKTVANDRIRFMVYLSSLRFEDDAGFDTPITEGDSRERALFRP
jgi:hypothetical protein